MVAGLGVLRVLTPDFATIVDKEQSLSGLFRWEYPNFPQFNDLILFAGICKSEFEPMANLLPFLVVISVKRRLSEVLLMTFWRMNFRRYFHAIGFFS